MPTNKTLLGEVEDHFTLEDIGSTLLEELAERLYQPQGVVREYIQNAVDAHRQWKNESGTEPEGPVGIVVRPNGLSIMDFGIGLTLDEIKKVKSIAVSRKRSADVKLTGHKGVGIWAGLSFFKRLTIYSTARGSDRGFELTIQFKQIKDAINEAVDIGAVLNPNYQIREFEEDVEEHYTNVDLEEPVISRELFLNPSFLNDVVRQICPCEIDPTFVFADKVTEWYQQHGIETFPIHVDNVPVYRSFPSDVVRFVADSITIDDKPFADYWMAIHKNGRVLKPQTNQMVGFNMIHNGFALGENLFSTNTMIGYDQLNVSSYLRWHIGEIHIIHPELMPNLKRDDLEESELARQFRNRVRQFYRDTAYQARIYSGQLETESRYKQFEKMSDTLLEQKPVQLNGDDLKRVQNIEHDLVEHDQQVSKYKSKSNTDRDVDVVVLKNTKLDRKRIQGKIRSLLSGLPQESKTSTVSNTETTSPTASSGKSNPENQDGQGPDSGSSTPKTSKQAATNGTSGTVATGSAPTTSATTQDDGNGQTEMSFEGDYVPVAVVLAFVEELLEQALPSDNKKRDALMLKLKQRVSLVTANAQR